MATVTGLIQELPKAELHLHLEGSAEPETLHELDPTVPLEEIRRHYRYEDFQGFLQSFKWVIEHLRSPGDYALITRHLLKRLAAANVTYAEITIAAGVMLWRNQELAPIYEAIRREALESQVEVWWIFDAVRQFGVAPAMRVAELAAERVNDGVVAYGIGGDEARGAAGLFKDIYAFAREKGLRLTAHAGETTGPESIWAALELGAERIGHGIRAIDDPVLIRHLAQKNIPLEICISSNLATGVVSSLRNHPLRRLYDAGIPIILNSDDPAMFRTTLSREYELAVSEFGFSEEELRELAGNSFRYSFRGATTLGVR